MTNEPEPNTRAGEALPCPWCSGKGFAQSPSLGHSSWRVICDDCCAEGPTVPSYNVDDPEAFCIIAWNNRIGNVAMSTWDHYAEEHVDTRPLPQPSELVERPSEAIEVLGGPYRQLDMDGVIVGVSRQAIYETLTYLTQLEAQITKLQADGNKLAGALEAFQRHYDLNDCDERCGALEVPISDLRRACQALTEWKDRA